MLFFLRQVRCLKNQTLDEEGLDFMVFFRIFWWININWKFWDLLHQILFLAFLLGLLLYLKPFNDEVRKVSKIENILPNADIVGRVYLLDFLTESADLMLFNEIAQRQFLTSEFVLSMAKQYGLDVQSPVYIFANERGDFGGVVPLFTAQKLKSALDRISLDNNVT